MNLSGKFPNVLGHISENERMALQRLVLETSAVDGDALEIGSLNGLSALIILSALASSKKLICVEIGQIETLKANLISHGVSKQWMIINEDFKKVCGTWKFSFIFVDHDHTFDNNRAAFDQFWGNLQVGGIMVYHDFNHPDFQDGTRAINAIMKGRGMEPYLQADSLIAFKK